MKLVKKITKLKCVKCGKTLAYKEEFVGDTTQETPKEFLKIVKIQCRNNKCKHENIF